jgi:hypothetical protein
MKAKTNTFFTLLMVAVVLAVTAMAELVFGQEGRFNSPGRTTYYIDSEKGDDNSNGTSPEKSWASLDRVNKVVFAPGDKILFKAGTTYTGRLKPQGSGAQGKPIIIDMYGGGNKPRIDGRGAVLDTLLLGNVEYWEVSNLEITNLGPARDNWREGSGG